MDSVQAALLVLVLVLAFVVGAMASLVKFLAHKVVDMSETRHLENAVARRSGTPAVFRGQEVDDVDDSDDRRPAQPPKDFWKPAPPGTRVGN